MILKKTIEILYTSSSVTGAYLVATNNTELRLLGYCLFLVSSLSYIWLLLKSNASWSLSAVSAMFLLINVKGIVSSL